MLISIIHSVNRAQGLNLDPLLQWEPQRCCWEGRSPDGRVLGGGLQAVEYRGQQGSCPFFGSSMGSESLWLLAGRTPRRVNSLPRAY